MKSFFKFLFIVFLIFSGLVLIGLVVYLYKLITSNKFDELLKTANKRFEDIQKKINIIDLKNSFPHEKVEDLEKKIGTEASKVKKEVAPRKVNKYAKIPKSVKSKTSPRQELVLNYLKNNPEIRISDIVNEFNSVSPRTLRRDLSKLEELGYVRQLGKTKDSKYRLLS